MKVRVLLAIFILFWLSHAKVVVNSYDWRDVVSGIYYAHMINDTVLFVPESGDPSALIKKIGSGNSIFLIESKNDPVYSGLDVLLINNGNSVEVYKSEDAYITNAELAKKSGAKNFILVNPSYGYPAVSVLAYAKQKKAFLLFADGKNLGLMKEVLKNAEEILVYGEMDESELAGLEYERINTGDKYEDNIEVAKRYFSINSSEKEVVLTDGGVLEESIISGDRQAIFISRIIPDSVYKYVKEQVERGQISSGIVVGEEHALAAYNLKKRINSELGGENFSVFVRMSQKTPGGELAPLDTFTLPSPVVSISIKEANYNDNAKAIEVVYQNDGNVVGYFKTSSSVYINGKYLAVIGDSEPLSIKPGEEKGVRYNLEIPAGMKEDIFLNLTLIHGVSQKTFDSGFSLGVNASRKAYEDASSLLIEEASYDPAKNEFVAKIKNTGPVDAYFSFSFDYFERGEKKTIEEDEVYKLEKGETGFIRISNLIIKDPGSAKMIAKIKYGERHAFLDKKYEREVSGRTEVPFEVVFAVLIIIIGVAVYLLWKRKRRRKRFHKEDKPLYRRIGLEV